MKQRIFRSLGYGLFNPINRREHLQWTNAGHAQLRCVSMRVHYVSDRWRLSLELWTCVLASNDGNDNSDSNPCGNFPLIWITIFPSHNLSLTFHSILMSIVASDGQKNRLHSIFSSEATAYQPSYHLIHTCKVQNNFENEENTLLVSPLVLNVKLCGNVVFESSVCLKIDIKASLYHQPFSDIWFVTKYALRTWDLECVISFVGHNPFWGLWDPISRQPQLRFF